MNVTEAKNMSRAPGEGQSALPMLPIVQPTLPDWEILAQDFKAIAADPKITVGKFVRLLEAEVERRLDVRHAIAVSSCTSGLMLAVRALGVTGEAILPPFTWSSTGLCLLWAGIEPVFADIEPGRYTLDPASFERAITPRTTAVLPVTVFGVAPDLDAIESIARRHGLTVIYDTAQGLGSTWRGRPLGGFGHVEVFSMSPTKVATSVEGGILTTNDDVLAGKLRRMRDYGKADDGDIDLLGLSARQSELHGAVGLRTVQALDAAIDARARIVSLYREGLSDLPGVAFQTVPKDTTTTWNYVTLFLSGDDLGADGRPDPVRAGAVTGRVHDALEAVKIQTKRYFYRPLHQQTVYAAYAERARGTVPVAELASARGLALPLYSHMPDSDVHRVIDAVRTAWTTELSR